MNRDLQTQVNAAYGFSVWLASTLPRQTEDSREFTNHLLHTLAVYRQELERQIDGDPATHEWFCLIATTTILVEMLQDELLELNPVLEGHNPSDEPQTIQEMISRLLVDALSLFEQSQNEMATYLEKPDGSCCVLQGFMQRVLTAHHVRAISLWR